jgi:type II restriction enzyme
MNLSMCGEIAAAFKSGSQKSGNVSETWGADNFYCPNCSSPKLDWLRPGYPASDYICPKCKFLYQLKSKQSPICNSITDGAYSSMMEAVRNDALPSFYFLHYDLATWSVRNLLLVPHFAFPPSAIIKRNPTQPKGRRKPWIGCNFDLSRIPADARIEIVRTVKSRGTEICSVNSAHRPEAYATFIIPPEKVREQFKRVKPFKNLSVAQRGWTLDVLNIVRRLGKSEFTNEDVYAWERELEALHPGNRHVRDKIRQQLQVLRDTGFLIHVGSGSWRVL